MIRTRCCSPATHALCGAWFLTLTFCVGCHSRFVETTIVNQGPKAIQMIEMDYPSASFGVGSLAPGAQFHYRFKIQGSGPLKLQFTDPKGQVHNVDGPQLQEGQEGSLTVAIDPAGNVGWQPHIAGNP